MDQAWWSPGLTHPDGTLGVRAVVHRGHLRQSRRQAIRQRVAGLRPPRPRGRRRAGRRFGHVAVLDDLRLRRRRRDTGCRRSRPPMCRWSNPRSTSRRGCGTPPTPWRNSPSSSACRRRTWSTRWRGSTSSCARGVDDDFGRGDEAYDRAFSGGAPPLYAIEKAPFHAAAFGISDLGTKGGLRTDTAARVLDASGQRDPRPVRGGQHDGRAEWHRLSRAAAIRSAPAWCSATWP